MTTTRILLLFVLFLTASANEDDLFEDDKELFWMDAASNDCERYLSVTANLDLNEQDESQVMSEMGDVMEMSRRRQLHASIVATPAQKWPRNDKGARVPTRLEDKFTLDELKKVSCAVDFFHKNTCVQFVQAKVTDTDYLNITKSSSGCYSDYIGKSPKGGEQVVNLDRSSVHCWKHGTIVHELLHAVGFFHEQSRNDRNDFIDINWRNIPDKYEDQFKTAKQMQIEQELVGDYDYKSVMHYPRNTFGHSQPSMEAKLEPTENNGLMGNRDAPTEMDVFKINSLYKCDGKESKDTWNKSEILLLGGTTYYDNHRDLMSDSVETLELMPVGNEDKQNITHHKDLSPEPAIPTLNTARRLHFAVVYQKKLFVGGGMSLDGWHLNVLDSVEVLDLDNKEQWVSGPKLNHKRMLAVAAVVHDRLIVCGGGANVNTDNSRAQRSCEMLHHTHRHDRKDWIEVAPMNKSRHSAAVASSGPFMYVMGGLPDDNPTSTPMRSVERYTASLNRWTFEGSKLDPSFVKSLPRFGCKYCAAAALSPYIYVCGGSLNGDGEEGPFNACEKYSPTKDEWSPVASMLHERTEFSMIAWNGFLVALGGKQMENSQVIEIYDPKLDRWNITEDSSLGAHRWGFAAVGT